MVAKLMDKKSVLLVVVVFILGGLAGFLGSWFAIPIWLSTHEFEANVKKLTVNNKGGQIVIGATDGQPQILMHDANKKIRLMLGLDAQDQSPTIRLADNNGDESLVLKQLEKGSSLLELHGTGQEAVTIEAANDYSNIALRGGDGELRAILSHNVGAAVDQTSFELRDSQGQKRFMMQTTDDKFQLSTYNAAGKERGIY